MCSFQFRRFKAILLVVLPCCQSFGAAISEESPFVVGIEQTQSGVQEVGFDWRGILLNNGIIYFNIVPSTTKKGIWVALNEEAPDFVVTGYFIEEGVERIRLFHHGRTSNISLKKVGKAQVRFEMNDGRVSIRFDRRESLPVPVSVAVIPTAPSEILRLQSFEAELQRRRGQN